MNRNLNALHAMWYRQVKRFWRAKSRVAAMIIQPVFWMIFFGLGWASAFRIGGVRTLFGGLDYLTFLMPGVIMMAIFMFSYMSGISVIWDKEFGYLKEILVAPVSRRASILGRMLGDSTVAVIQGIIIFCIAYPLTPTLRIMNVPIVILVAFLTSLSFTSVGTIIATKMRSQEGFQLIVNMISMPTLFLSGAFYPIDTMPTWMKYLAYINPLTYGVDATRILLTGSGSLDLTIDAILLLLLSTILVMLATQTFKKATIE